MSALADTFEVPKGILNDGGPEGLAPMAGPLAGIIDVSTLPRTTRLEEEFFIGRQKLKYQAPVLDIADTQLCLNGEIVSDLESGEIGLLNTLITNAGRGVSRANFMDSGFTGTAIEFLQTIFGLVDKLKFTQSTVGEQELIEARGERAQRTYRVSALIVRDTRTYKLVNVNTGEAVVVESESTPETQPEVTKISEPTKGLILKLLDHEQKLPNERVLQSTLFDGFLAANVSTDFEKECLFFKSLEELQELLSHPNSPINVRSTAMLGQRAFKLEFGEHLTIENIYDGLLSARIIDYSDVAPLFGVDPVLYQEALLAMKKSDDRKRLSKAETTSLVDYVQLIDRLEHDGQTHSGKAIKHFVRQADRALKYLFAKTRKSINHYAFRLAGAGNTVEELVVEGQAGLLDAIRRWDNTHEAAFSTYAMQRIHGTIVDYIRKQGPARSRVGRLQELRDKLYNPGNFDERGNSTCTSAEWQELSELGLLQNSSLDEMVESYAGSGRSLYDTFDESESGDPVSDDAIDAMVGLDDSMHYNGDDNPISIRDAYNALEDLVEALPERDRTAVSMYLGLYSLLDVSAQRWMTLHKHRSSSFGGIVLADIGDFFGFTESRAVQIIKPQVDKIKRSRKIQWALEGRDQNYATEVE
ncbi:MAG TPA: sigma-70 family RNA polymerase sigma factor [Candidatus Saccharimonadales bacterium]|nr:sigma-70 family RNA polymerase sigma factor [Candidatus Saccharimonadales bacterium]